MIKNDINIFLEKILSPKYNSFFFEHPDRNSINSEIDAVIVARKDTKEKALFLRERYKNISYPDNNGLSENNIIIRKHNNKSCIKLMENWWEEIRKYSHRDQLSLSYIIWKTGIKVKYLSKGIFWENINLTSHAKLINF